MKSTSIKQLSLVMLAVGVLTGCGLKPLTDEQKTQVATTLTSAGRTHQAVPNTTSLHSGFASALSDIPAAQHAEVVDRFRALSWLTGDTSHATTPDSTTTAMKDKITTAKTAGTCTVSYPTSSTSTTSSSSAASFKVSIDVTGDSCPISMAVSIAGSGAETSAEITASMKYEVKNEEFRALNDVDKFDITGSIKVSVSSSGTDASIDGSLEGTFHSQAKGDIKFALEVSVSSSGSGVSGSVSMKLEYADFTAELKQTFDGTTSKHTINGVEATEAEFEAYFNSLGTGTSLP